MSQRLLELQCLDQCLEIKEGGREKERKERREEGGRKEEALPHWPTT